MEPNNNYVLNTGTTSITRTRCYIHYIVLYLHVGHIANNINMYLYQVK